jgi:glutamine synthetase type III
MTCTQLQVVFEQVMPGELDSRGVSDVLSVCAAVLADLERDGRAAGDASATSPDDIFRRLADA